MLAERHLTRVRLAVGGPLVFGFQQAPDVRPCRTLRSSCIPRNSRTVDILSDRFSNPTSQFRVSKEATETIAGLQWSAAYILRLSWPPYILPHRQLSFATAAYREISSKRTTQIQLLYGFVSC